MRGGGWFKEVHTNDGAITTWISCWQAHKYKYDFKMLKMYEQHFIFILSLHWQWIKFFWKIKDRYLDSKIVWDRPKLHCVCAILNADKILICPQETFSSRQKAGRRKKILTLWNMAASHFEQKVGLRIWNRLWLRSTFTFYHILSMESKRWFKCWFWTWLLYK